MDKPSILSQKNIFKADLFDIKELQVKMPTGKTKTYSTIFMHPTIVVFPVTEKWEVYLLSEYRFLLGRETINGIGGYVEPEEIPLKAARRELMEEAGIEAEQLEELLLIDKHASVLKAQEHIFLAKGLTFSKAHPEEDESLRLIKLPLADAVKKVLSGQITVASTIMGILTLDALRKERKLIV